MFLELCRIYINFLMIIIVFFSYFYINRLYFLRNRNLYFCNKLYQIKILTFFFPYILTYRTTFNNSKETHAKHDYYTYKSTFPYITVKEGDSHKNTHKQKPKSKFDLTKPEPNRTSAINASHPKPKERTNVHLSKFSVAARVKRSRANIEDHPQEASRGNHPMTPPYGTVPWGRPQKPPCETVP